MSRFDVSIWTNSEDPYHWYFEMADGTTEQAALSRVVEIISEPVRDHISFKASVGWFFIKTATITAVHVEVMTA